MKKDVIKNKAEEELLIFKETGLMMSKAVGKYGCI